MAVFLVAFFGLAERIKKRHFYKTNGEYATGGRPCGITYFGRILAFIFVYFAD